MAFLMYLCEKMRLTRQINTLSLKQMQNASALSRMTTKIKKRQDFYAKLEKQIDRQASTYINQANNSIFSNFTNINMSFFFFINKII